MSLTVAVTDALNSPNLPYSKGIGSPAVAIPLLKVMYRVKLCRGKLK
jgi:hypothetical protein